MKMRRLAAKVLLVLVAFVLLAAVIVLVRFVSYAPGEMFDDSDLTIERVPLAAESNAYTYLLLATNISFGGYDYVDLLENVTNMESEVDLLSEVLASNAVALGWIDRARRAADWSRWSEPAAGGGRAVCRRVVGCGKGTGTLPGPPREFRTSTERRVSSRDSPS